MEGIVRLFLITILATSANAKYEYNIDQVQAILSKIHGIKSLWGVRYENMETEVEWHVKGVCTETDVHFEVKDVLKSSGQDCGGGPAIRKRKDLPMLCLFKILFHSDVQDGYDIVRLGFLFRSSENINEWTLIAMQVFTVPDNEPAAYSRTGVQFWEPITNEHTLEVVYGRSFSQPSFFLKRMLNKRIFPLGKKREKELVGRVHDKVHSVYYSPPILMKESTLENILSLPSVMVELMKNRQKELELIDDHGEITDEVRS